MSKQNVLAVMDAEISAAMDACKSMHGSPRLTALAEARAAVAELIETAKSAAAALMAAYERHNDAESIVHDAIKPIRAALARAGGDTP